MVSINLSSLVKKLNPICLKALENAAGLCLSRTNYNVEFEHWLLRILEAQNTDAYAICRHFNVDVGRLIKDLTRSLDKFRTGNSRTPTFSQNVIDLAKDAWVVGSLDYGAPKTRSGHLLIVFLGTDRFALQARETSAEFTKIQVETLRTQLRDITSKTDEEALDEQERAAAAPGGAAGAGGAPGTPGQPGKAKALDQFTEDLTAKAKAGKIDPILGRDSEIRQVIDILTRRRQNNPIMTGEAGVGKTAVVEGFAQRIAAGDVPPMLRNVSLRSLDLGLLQAGASVKGEFENRLKNVIEEVKASPTPIILFIDEAHTLIGAGGAAGQNDAANLLKPALARGELRTVAATTWAEYKKYFEKDAALARRFQVVKVEEPEEKVAIQMMRGLVGTLEKHHKVRILDEAVVDSVRLSHRYISGRQLPDKSVSLLDTACARVSMSQHAKPGPVEDVERRIAQLVTAIEILERESAVGTDHVAQLTELREQKAAAEAELATINGQWEKEKALAVKMREIREKLEGQPVGGGGATALAASATPAPAAAAPAAPGSAPAAPAPAPAAPKAPPPPPLTPEQRKALQEELATLEDELDEVQGELPLISVCVGGTAVADVVSNWTGIPVGRMVSDEIQTVLKLKDKMEERIVGQPHALEAIAQRIRMSRANLTDPRRPIGVFLLVGTSGVGKTETAITLADLLYGGEQNMTVINMSEYKEEHRISQLIGSPKGYVGYGEGGVLTEAVRRRPYSVVLLDEMEKAHPGLQDMFYQVFDKGTLTDGEGREIDFKNTVILMTSNAGTDTIIKLWGDPDTMPDAEGLGKVLFPELMKTFKPAFLGRLSIVPYFPLGDAILKQIVELQLGKIRKRILENYKAKMTYSPELVQTIAGRCTEVQTGARNVDHIISKSLLPELSAQFLAKLAAGEAISAVHIGVQDDAFTYELT